MTNWQLINAFCKGHKIIMSSDDLFIRRVNLDTDTYLLVDGLYYRNICIAKRFIDCHGRYRIVTVYIHTSHNQSVVVKNAIKKLSRNKWAFIVDENLQNRGIKR